MSRLYDDIIHHPHVIPDTTPPTWITHSHGPGNAVTNGPVSSFQTPVVAGQASPYTRPTADPSLLPSFSSSTSVAGAARPLPLETFQMGHGQSKATLPLIPPLLPPQSLTPDVSDAGLPTTKVVNVAGTRLQRTFAAKRMESIDSYSQGTTAETITVSISSSPSSPPTISSEIAPHSIHSLLPQQSPIMTTAPSQALHITSSSNPQLLSQPSALSSAGSEPPSTASPPSIHQKSTLDVSAAAGNRSSVIALSPGISSAINFMMMDWQEPSKSQLVADTSSSLPLGDADSAKASREKESASHHGSGSAPTSPDKREMKESWRKSDSTNSHHTVRANSFRASRPVSWAESFHSAYTIVPSNGSPTAPQGQSPRRLSGLIADVDFGVREEELEEDFATQNPNKDGNLVPPTPDQSPPPVNHKPTDLLKKAKRRSISLSSALPGPVATLLAGGKSPQPEPPVTTMPSPASQVSYSTSMDSSKNVIHSYYQQPSENHWPPVSLLSADVHDLSTSQLTSDSHSTQDNIPPQKQSPTFTLKRRLQASLPPLPKSQDRKPVVPPSSLDLDSPADAFTQYQTLPSATPSSNSSHFRQPTMSSLGPSAAGLAKRAVERMGRRLGGMMHGLSSSSNSSGSRNSSSTSISTSMSTSVTSKTSVVPSPLDSQQSQVQGAGVPGRTPSRGANRAYPGSAHSVISAFLPGPSKSGGHKRLPRSLGSPATMAEFATSGGSSSALSSASTSASTSESDPFSPEGPNLGQRLRDPLKKGFVFGKQLKTTAEETKVMVRESDDAVDAVQGSPSKNIGPIKALESRMLPAVVVRCAQHLLIWGVQEEGLFRVNGRPRHVSHLRLEFDCGADYDMTECSPGDLDPHAVASVFKAYLRELPDSIFTPQLQPYFDAAINKENSFQTYEQQSRPQQASNKFRQGLPRTPVSIRKAPSLSTFALPSFSQVPPPSKSLVYALRSLIAQLPPENRDLLRTVVDLIKATAKGSKATKMPLSNLLLLFCPSLNISPPLLRVLCEVDGIWEEETIISKSREPVEGNRMVDSDGQPVPLSSKWNTSAHDRDETNPRSRNDEESSLRSGRASSDKPSSLEYHASAEEDSLFSEERVALRRRDIVDRPEVPTVYLDTQSRLSSSSASLLQDDPETHRPTRFFRQDIQDDGSISSGPYSFKNDKTSPSPPLSSSAESVSTPTSSANPSFSNLPLDVGNDPEQQKRSDPDLPSANARGSPRIVGLEPGEIQIGKRLLISNPIPITGPLPVPFPSLRNRENGATIPSRRRSIPILSLSSLSSHSSGSPPASSKSSPSQPDSGQKRPSLKLLFSKKSSPSLFEDRERLVISSPMLLPPGLHQEQASPGPGSGSDSSISTPLSAVTAPQGSSLLYLPRSSSERPPVLNTLIEDPSLKIGELIPDKDSPKSRLDTPSSGLSPPPLSGRSISNSKQWLSSLPAKLDSQPSLSSRLPPSQPRDEDWVMSVLMAADAASL